MDLLASTAGLIIGFPVIAAIAALIFLSSGRPIFFRQWRLGRDGQKFQLLKFRTMAANAKANGLGVTRSGDTRVTPLGRWLRKWKLDELPQLLNVLRGEMTLVGPRPDLEEFWSLASTKDQAVLALTPGITGAASLAFCDEERVLAAVPPGRLIGFYLEELLPHKRPEIACILTPAATHRALTVQCAQAGIHVLCEKPMAVDLTDALAMARSCDDEARSR